MAVLTAWRVVVMVLSSLVMVAVGGVLGAHFKALPPRRTLAAGQARKRHHSPGYWR